MSIDVKVLTKKIKELADQVDSILKISRQQQAEIRREYQTWYSQTKLLVKTHLPERFEEFCTLYLSPNSPWQSYWGISSYLQEPNERDLFEADFEQQKGILLAIPHIIDLRALEVTALVTADLVQGELSQIPPPKVVACSEAPRRCDLSTT